MHTQDFLFTSAKVAVTLLQVCGDEEKSHLWPHGYVLKVMNSLDSQNLPLVEAQTETSLYLGKILVTRLLLVTLDT